MSRKATRQLNMMAKHKNAPALGQGEEESSCGEWAIY